MIIRLIFILFLVTGCDKYLGTIEDNYIPSENISSLNKSKIKLSSNELIQLNSTIKENSSIFSIPFGNLKSSSNFSLNRIFKKKPASNYVQLNNDIFFISDDFYLMSYADGKLNKIEKIPKSSNNKLITDYYLLKKDNKLIIVSDYGEVYYFDEVISLIYNLNIMLNSKPILHQDNLIIFTLGGDILTFNIFSNEVRVADYFDTNFGYKDKIYNSYIFDNSLFYTYNNNTVIFLDLLTMKVSNNFVLDTVSITSNMTDFSDLVNTPIYNKYGTFLVSNNGKIINFDFSNDLINWEINLLEKVNNFTAYSNSLAVLTNKRIIILDSLDGSIMAEAIHNIESPNSMAFINNKLIIAGNDIFTFFDILQNKINLDFRIKHKNKNLNNIGYSSGDLYLRSHDSVYLLSE